eukprot:4453622-Amphidinium_carterae.1
MGAAQALSASCGTTLFRGFEAVLVYLSLLCAISPVVAPGRDAALLAVWAEMTACCGKQQQDRRFHMER